MTKEELRIEGTQTIQWECTPMIDRLTFINGYIAGAEPKEERIAELKRENAELKERNRSYEQLIDKGSATLMQEKLKNYKQLTKAKNLIENIIRVTWGEGWSYSLDWKVKAEQFLKEERSVE